jgi:hypothetical protein
MIPAFINIRFKQFSRTIQGLGLMRFIFLLALFFFLAFILFMQTSKTPESFYTSGIYLMIIFIIQLKRADKTFLKIHLRNFRQILMIEYLLLTLPLFFCLIYHLQWVSVISVALITVIIVNFDFKPSARSMNTVIQRLIPPDCFEWKSGLRRTLFIILSLWLIGISTSFFIGSVPVVLAILGILLWSFYEKGEPIRMILAFEKGTNSFLIHKIKTHLVFFSVLAVPLILAFLIFHPDKWYVLVAEYVIIISTHIYVILTKYAFYQPGNKSNGAQAFEMIGAIGMILPFFIPVVWLLSIRFYFKSRENLNFYLNDYN